MSGALQNPSMNVCHSQSKPTGKSQSCHSSHYNPQKAIKLSPTLTALEQGAFANAQAVTLWATWKTALLWYTSAPSFPSSRGLCFCNYSAKNTDGLCNSSVHPASHAGLGTATSGGQVTSQEQCWEEKQAPNSQPSSLGSEIATELSASQLRNYHQ